MRDREVIGDANGETIRELDARWDLMTFSEQNAALRSRNQAAEALLRKTIRMGDKFRARAGCCRKEATLSFVDWQGGWLLTKSGLSISPGAVFSVNGKIVRVRADA